MPRLLLVLWLIGSILGYGMVLAADVHDGSPADTVHLLADSPDSPDPAVDLDGCDHCCHGVTHLLGLVALASPLPMAAGTSFGVRPPPAFRPFPPSSLDRPPSLG